MPIMKTKSRVVVAMSGGVDSSVAAYLLKKQGYEVIGVTMRLWSAEVEMASKHNRQCCSIEDTQDAKRVCQILEIPHYVLNFEKEFQKHVMGYFIQEYKQGRTPHPCIACNDKIKFAFFLDRAMTLDADFIATGHYAKLIKKGEEFHLERAVDKAKDQTYVLYGLSQKDLKRSLFPIGDLPKEEVRIIAKELELPVADKPDSQEICFVPNGDYREFLIDKIEFTTGPIIDLDGNTIGSHNGTAGYTIGQRKGLPSSNTGKRQFVVNIDAESNTIVVGDQESLFSTGLSASDSNFITENMVEVLKKNPDVTAKLRYQAPMIKAKFIPGENDSSFALEFDSPQRAVTPGQAVVLYQNDVLVGGGKIDQGTQTDSDETSRNRIELAAGEK